MQWRQLRPWLLTPDNPPGSYEALLRLLSLRERDGRLVAPGASRWAAVAVASAALLAVLVAGFATCSPSRVPGHHRPAATRVLKPGSRPRGRRRV